MWPQPLILPMAALVFGAGLMAGHVHAGQPQALPEVLIPIRMPGDPEILLPAHVAGSGLPLTWEVATGPAMVSGNMVTLTGELGPVTLKASQPGDAAWDPLVGYVSFTVSEEGGYTQVSMGGEGNLANWYALSRTARITGWNIYRSSGPVRTPVGTRWRSISAGGGYLPLAVSEDGVLWIWDKSFLGSIPKPNREAGDPVRLGGDNDWSTIAAGRIGRIGIKKEGTLWAWEDEVGRPAKQPEKFDSRTDWAESSITSQDYAIVMRSNGECYYPNVYNKRLEPVDNDLWKTGSISQSGMVRVKMDGTLWFRYMDDSSQVIQLSSEIDWTAVACLRSSYMALRSDGTLWSAPMTGGLKGVRSPVAYPAPTRWAKIDPGYAAAGLISRDGSLWVRGTTFSRIAPAFFPQTLDFMAAREQPFPVVSGSILAVPEAALNSRLPVELTVVSGPAEIVGQGIFFTAPGLVEISFKQAGNATWGFFEERRTFLSGAPGPEIAVHDGTLATSPARQNAGAVVELGKKTRSQVAAGLVRNFVLENTGTDPLHLTGITSETPGPLTFTTPFVPVTLPPGGSVLLELTLGATEYGIHTLNLLLHSNDTDEAAYRISFRIELANTPPYASTGPDRQVHAGSTMRLDGAFFSGDLEQPAAALSYHWDLDGNGYSLAGAVQEITLANPGQRLTAKLRVTDADGAVAFSECVIGAVVQGMEISTAMRKMEDGFFELIFHGTPGRKYRIYVSYDLANWRREDDSFSPKSPVSEPGADGFFPAKIWGGGLERYFYRAQEVQE